MRFCVDWTLFLDVNSRTKCDRLVDKIAKTLDLEFAVINIESYWKDKTLFKVNARSTFDAPTVRDALYSVMKTTSRLAHAWIVAAPAEDENWEFTGAANPGSIRLQGVDSISFAASNARADVQSPEVVQA